MLQSEESKAATRQVLANQHQWIVLQVECYWNENKESLMFFFKFFKFFNLPLFLPNFVVSNCCSSYYLVSSLQLPYGLGRDEGWSHASSDTQPNQAALLLNTARIQPGSQPHQCVGGYTVHLATLASAHCTRPATGVAGARWDKDIPTDQSLPNPDNARPIVQLEEHLYSIHFILGNVYVSFLWWSWIRLWKPKSMFFMQPLYNQTNRLSMKMNKQLSSK